MILEPSLLPLPARPTVTQALIFEEVSQLIQSALDGYHVCIFAYGQTGSGKTYTMEGEGSSAAGIIPRSVDKIFACMAGLEQQGWKFELECEYLEVYQDEVFDLMADDRDRRPLPVKSSKDSSAQVCQVVVPLLLLLLL